MSAERVLAHRWSSLPLFMGKNRPECLAAGTVLTESGGLADSAAGWRRYIAYLGVLAEEDARRRDEKFGRLSRGWLVGSAKFKAELKQELVAQSTGGERFELLGADREAHREARAELWEEQLRSAAKATGTSLDHLPAAKSAPEKLQLAAAMKTTTSVSNGWLAARLQMGSAGTVSQYVRRFHLRGGAETREFKMLVSRVHT